MPLRRSDVPFLLGTLLLAASCSSAPGADGTVEGAAAASIDAAAGAMADLQAAAEWTAPRCRWLHTGDRVFASPQEAALYQAADDLGYIEMEQAGQDDRVGRGLEPAWRISLTKAGRAVAVHCPAASTADTWGIPVSRRRFISAKHAGRDAGGRTVYEVEFAWVPTEVGGRVKHVLTDAMAVEEGTWVTKVYLKSGADAIARGSNGWAVAAIDDLGATRRRSAVR